jgi:hypothetical protein
MAANKISLPLLFGLIAALCSILFVLGTYLAGPSVFLGWPSYLGILIIVLIAAIAATVEKRAKGGVLDFRGALKVAYGTLALGVIGQNFFTWLLLDVIDPAFKQRLIPVMLANTEKAYRAIGAPQDELQHALENVRSQDQFSLGRFIQGMGFLLVIYFLVALLIAVTIKSKKGPAPKLES